MNNFFFFYLKSNIFKYICKKKKKRKNITLKLKEKISILDIYVYESRDYGLLNNLFK